MDSSEDFINEKRQINIVKSLQEPIIDNYSTSQNKERKGEIEKEINLICKHQKQFIITSLKKLLEKSIENTKIICDYIIAEQNEINIKESTKEGKIKVLVDFIIFNNYKNLEKTTKVDILSYLNKFRKDEQKDPEHRWIGTWNNRHLVLNKFFRWLNDSDNPDIKNRKAHACMKGVKRLSRKEISRYKPSDLWTTREGEVFLKYCPSKRDRAFFSMAMDTSARPHELLNLKIEDLKFKTTSDGSKQYAEITINGKTGQRTVSLINSLPYIKEWILDHPLSNDKKYWIFISEGKASFGNKLTRDGLLKHFQEYYKQKYYPNLPYIYDTNIRFFLDQKNKNDINLLTNNKDYQNLTKSLDTSKYGIIKLNESLINIKNELINIIDNLIRFQTQLTIQQTTNAIQNILKNNISENDKRFQDLYTFLKENLSSNFVINAPLQYQSEYSCAAFQDKKKELCVWDKILNNNSKNHASIDLAILNLPQCNSKYYPTYINDINVSNYWADCIIKEKVNNYLNNFNTTYNKFIFFPLLGLKDNQVANKTQIFKNITIIDKEIKNKLNSINYNNFAIFTGLKFKNELPERENDILQSIQDLMANSITIINNDIGNSLSKITNQITATLTNLNNTNQSQNIYNIIKRINDTESLFSKAAFPLVSFPLDFKLSIGIFPIALAIGFLISLNLFQSILDLRRELHDYHLNEDSERKTRKTIDKKIRLIAPLWVDPIYHNYYTCIQFFILVIPMLIFFVSCFFISFYLIYLYPYNQDTLNFFTKDGLLLIIIIYALCSFLITFNFFSLLIKIRNYRDEILNH